LPFRHRKPPWLKVPAPGGTNYRRLKKAIEADDLHTVCQEANCPNVGECWERGTATFMILGDVCTRRCGFCNVQTGKPTWHDPLEPMRVANQVKRMGLRHAVVGRPRRPTRLRGERVRGCDPLDQDDGSGMQG
jgi:lipoic acid synthetase